MASRARSDDGSSAVTAESWQSLCAERDDVSAFRRAALELCFRIPKGRVSTYKRLAEATGIAIGKPGSARAAGGAMRHNPFAPIVPCHRVVGSNLTLVGYKGASDPASNALTAKCRLLESEGVPILMPECQVASSRVYTFTDEDIEAARLASEEQAEVIKRRRPTSPKRAASKKSKPGSSKRPRFPSPASLRLACREGRFDSQTSGLCGGFAQANLVIVPSAYAEDFREYCRLNPKPCPLLEATDPGSSLLRSMAPGSDVRSDLPRYRVWRRGVADKADVRDVFGPWAEMSALCDAPSSSASSSSSSSNSTPPAEEGGGGAPVAFLLGCSFSFEEALQNAEIPVRHIEQGVNVPMYITTLQTKRSGPFRGPLVVSMRPMPEKDVERAREITARFSRVHGAPVHVGSPNALGIRDLSKPDFGDAVELKEGDVPVFWACGVTPQMALRQARIPLAVTHSPGHMLVLDKRNADLADG